jgi:hypothetical protein
MLMMIPLSACQTQNTGTPRHPLASGGGSAASGSGDTTNSFTDWDVNDVSVMFPLPAFGQSASLLLGLDAQAKGGILLSQSKFAQMVTGPGQVAYAGWRVISFRFDTCGVDSALPGLCLPQLRLEVMPAGAGATEDAAIHLIYNIDPLDLVNVVLDLHTLKTTSPAKTSGVPLGIHPGLAAAGLDSDYARSVEAFVRKYVGEPQLVRIAALLIDNTKTRFLDDTWTFAASAVDSSGTLTPLNIPGTSTPLITLETKSDPSPPNTGGGIPAPGAPRDVVAPTPSGTDHLDILLSVADIKNASDADLQAQVDTALRLENPPLNNPLTVDCVGCHMASRQLTIASRLRQFTTDGNANKFVIPAGVTGTFNSPDRLDTVFPTYFTKAFGYQNGNPSFIERTVNESANIASQLNFVGGLFN